MHISKFKLAVAGILALGAQQAFAVGTTAGTDVTNTASVDYVVGGVNQPDVTSNTVVFEVDRRINFTVVETGNVDTIVGPGSTSQVLTFTVTNTTNATMDFSLIAANDLNASAHGGTDNFDATNVRVFVDSNGNGIYDPGTDTQTFLDEVPADASRTVFIVADIPAGRVTGDLATYSLTGVAADAGTAGNLGATSVQTAGADSAAVVDTVFADAAGDGSATDVARDGRASDDDAYIVQAAAISVVKSSRVISDPINGTTNPKRIPGAVVEYCIEVVNAAGGATANSVVVSDSIAGQPVTFNASSILTGSSSCTAADGAVEDADTAGADETDPSGGSFATNVVTGNFPTLNAGATARLQFRVTIN